MPIFPLPQFEADIETDRRDRETYDRLKPPSTIVVRFGAMRLIGEFPYSGEAKPGCGSKIVVRTHRGLEIGEMLTTACPNSGCAKAVSRQEMLQYFENSGGKDYPFFTEGRVLRIATAQDMAEQSRLDASKHTLVRAAREQVALHGLPMKIIEAEPLLGGDRIVFYFTSEDRVDFRELAQELSHRFSARIDLRQVGARDEARLVADYERCGQHCCCKQFLKVLKPISIKAAKTQKATLDPLKISGRCGRLMCCLRYEDETYNDLLKRLPRIHKVVGTPSGVGVVIDRQILTQLVLVRLEHDGSQIAVPVEELMPPDEAPPPPGTAPPRGGAPAPSNADPLRGMAPDRLARRITGASPSPPDRAPNQSQDRFRQRGDEDRPLPPHAVPSDPESHESPSPGTPAGSPHSPTDDQPSQGERSRRDRRNRGRGQPPHPSGPQSEAGSQDRTGQRDQARPRGESDSATPETEPNSPPPEGHSRKRRRRRHRPGESGSHEKGGGSGGPDGAEGRAAPPPEGA